MDKSKGGFLAVVVIVLLQQILAQPVLADIGITNGDFSQDSLGWTLSENNAFVGSDTPTGGNVRGVLLSENDDSYSVSYLYQNNIEIPLGATQLLFDFTMNKTIPETGDTDYFKAMFGIDFDDTTTPPSLNVLRSFSKSTHDFSGTTDSGTGILDLAGLSSGPYTLYFQLENNPDGFITSVLIDNVRFAPVPVPSAFLLAVIGMFSAAASKKLKV